MGGKPITKDEIRKWARMHADNDLTFTEIAKREGRSRKSVSEKVREYLKREEEEKEAKFQAGGPTEGKLAAEVFRLFNKGCKPTKVVQELEIDPKRIKELYEKYQELEGMFPPRVEEIERTMNLLFPNGCVHREIRRKGLNEILDDLLEEPFSSFCGFSLTDQWVCPVCETEGKVAIRFKCMSCSHSSWWGYHPE